MTGSVTVTSFLYFVLTTKPPTMKKLTYGSILFFHLLPLFTCAQTDSLAWLKMTIAEAVGKEVTLVDPAEYMVSDVNYMLEGYRSDDDSEYQIRRYELITGETKERKSQLRADYGTLYFRLDIYVGSLHEIMEMFHKDGDEDDEWWKKEEDHNRSAVVALSKGDNYIVCIYNFPRKDRWPAN